MCHSYTVELNIMSTLLFLPCTVLHLRLLIVFTPTIPGVMTVFFSSLSREQNTVTVSSHGERRFILSSSAAGSIDLWIAFTLAGSGHYCSRNKPAVGFWALSSFSMDFNKVLPVVLDVPWSGLEFARRHNAGWKSVFFFFVTVWNSETAAWLQQESLTLFNCKQRPQNSAGVMFRVVQTNSVYRGKMRSGTLSKTSLMAVKLTRHWKH